MLLQVSRHMQLWDIMAAVPYCLNFYLRCPPDGLLLREIEDASFKRLQLLHDLSLALEDRGNDTSFDIRFNDLKAGFYFAPSKGIGNVNEVEGCAEVHLKDEVSHYIVKLACCADSEKCKWFVNLETQLFLRRLQFYPDNPTTVNEFLRQSIGTYYSELPPAPEKELGYKVPLAQCTHLLVPHKLAPEKGFVRVPVRLLPNIVAKFFEEMLEYSMENVQGNLALIEEDDRLSSLIRRLRNPAAMTVSRPVELKTKLTVEQVDAASRHFPPCMKVLYQYLKREHHLKHYGRLQFALFLKAIGMPFEDALKFWKGEFCQKMTPDKFHKEYEYNIRHSYGRVGKMTDYSSQGCSKLAHMPQPAAQEHHGCPFRHMNQEDLVKVLLSYGLNPLELQPILEKAEMHQQVACIRLFKTVHKGCPEAGLEHVGHFPGAFYAASKRLSTF